MSVQTSPSSIPLAEADPAIAAAKAEADEFGVPFSIAVVDL